MALTSDRLKELTKRKMELIKDIDKAPSNAALKETMKAVDAEIAKERSSLMSPSSSTATTVGDAQKQPGDTAIEKPVTRVSRNLLDFI